MNKLTIPVLQNRISAEAYSRINYIEVPGSKSITNRALLLASLSDGHTKLTGALFSDDSRHFINCVNDLGIKISVDEARHSISIDGTGYIPSNNASIYVGSAGTAARFLAATLGMSSGSFFLDSSEQMKKRPMAPLLKTLRDAGCTITFKEKEDHFPFTITTEGNKASELTVNIDSSSQFLSALLIASVLSDNDLDIHVTGSHGMAYIEMTINMMKQFGVSCIKINDESHTDRITYHISSGQKYLAQDYSIEPDASAAAYFYAMSPLLGLKMCVKGVNNNSMQGDIQFIHTLVKMGCSLDETDNGLVLLPPADGIIHGIEVNMSSFSDQAITLACIAPFADSPTTIAGIGHIRMQESDRINAICTELTKLGIKVEENPDSIKIYPGTVAPCSIDTYDDHRMAMGFALIGLKTPGIIINNPECCAKTFENYFDVLTDFVESCIQSE